MNRVSSLACGALTGIALLLASTLAHAGDATDLVKTKQTTVRDLWTKTPADEKRVAEVTDQLFDYGAMAESALGSEWGARSDAERADFTGLFKQLVRIDYNRMVKKVLGSRVDYLGEEATAGGIIVKTKATPRPDVREEPIAIDFSVAQKDGKWKVRDIVTEGVSLVTSYRSQFTKTVKKEGYKALITAMKAKVAQGG